MRPVTDARERWLGTVEDFVEEALWQGACQGAGERPIVVALERESRDRPTLSVSVTFPPTAPPEGRAGAIADVTVALRARHPDAWSEVEVEVEDDS